LARNKGDKDYTKSEKQLLISLINDYSLFGATDSEIIQMLSTKIGKKISETLFYRLKKEAVKKRGESDQWLDSFVRYQYVEYHRKRMEEIEYVQRCLLKLLAEETEKEKDKQDKSIINQLSKTIAEISKVLADFGMAPPILSKISNIISMNYNGQGNQDSEELRQLRVQRQQAKSAITIPSSNEDQYGNKEEDLEEYDSNAVF
jgi:hypothetical protein